MAEPSFSIDAKTSEGKKNISMSFYVFGFRIRKRLGWAIYPVEWDKRKQLVKSINDYYEIINKAIVEMYEKAKKAEKHFILLGKKPESEQEFLDVMLKEPEITQDELGFYPAFKRYIKKKSLTLSDSTMKTYSTLLYRLNEWNPNLKVLSQPAIQSFEEWSIKQKYGNNLIIKHITILKDFADSQGLNIKHKTSIKRKKFDSLALNEKELQAIWEAKVSDSLQNTKVRFMIMCYTGMRLQDSKRFKESNVVILQDVPCVQYRASKNGVKCIIPCSISPILMEAIEQGFKITSDAKFRTGIKKLCKIAGIDQIEHLIRYKGGQPTSVNLPKYEFITPHTARRTFVTMMFYRGFTPSEVKPMSGHSMTEIIEIYDKTKAEENAIKLHHKHNVIKKNK